eukprot:Partr_v1_DN24372_c0_g1_i3_m31689
MDQTLKFRQHVNSISANSTTGSIKRPQRTARDDREQSRKLLQDAQSIAKNLKSLMEMLHSNSRFYLDIDRHLLVSPVANSLSTAASSNADRDLLDEQTNALLATYMNGIRLLESQVKDLSKKQKARNEQLVEHWQRVLASLKLQLERVSQVQKDMQEKRIEYLMLRRGFQYPTASTQILDGASNAKLAVTDPETEEALKSISKEQQMEMMQENTELLDQMSGMEAEVEKIVKSLHEISRLQSQLGEEMLSQDMLISRIEDDAFRTGTNLDKGNRIIAKIAQDGVPFRNYMIWFFLTMAFVLYFLHWYD